MPPNTTHLHQMEVFEALHQPGNLSAPEHRAGGKLARTKQRWAAEGRGLTGETTVPATRRLPPGQHQVRDFPVVDLGTRPHVATEDWTLTVSGAVHEPVRWDWDMLLRQPQETRTNDIHCVTFWSRFDNTWNGVSMRHLLAAIRLRPEAKYVIARGYDGYATNLPISIIDNDEVLLATHWQGKPLTREHGAPVRLVVPGRYFWKSTKWLRSLLFSEHEIKGYWESHGNHNDGDPWTEQRYG
jgi:DMSO/TMAO reductase YedYZ molybdopterin-dependent catalytic subunit